jgi:hypothetical protein
MGRKFIDFCMFRWQQEVAETVFETVNLEADKIESKRKSKQKQRFDADEKDSDCILHGYIKKLGGAFASVWQTRYAKLYPNRYVVIHCMDNLILKLLNFKFQTRASSRKW